MQIRRLGAGDEKLARDVFTTMAEVFEEAADGVVDDEYARRLLRRADFWVLAATEGSEVLGGVTAHALPMTRTPATELFIYDLAVRASWQRRGVGRSLMLRLLELAKAAGIETSFVPADNEDHPALDFYRAIGGQAEAVTFFTFTP